VAAAPGGRYQTPVNEAFSSWSWVFGHGLIMDGVVVRGVVKFLVGEVIVRAAFDGHRVKKPLSA
jgi:hypothetical protein